MTTSERNSVNHRTYNTLIIAVDREELTYINALVDNNNQGNDEPNIEIFRNVRILSSKDDFDIELRCQGSARLMEFIARVKRRCIHLEDK